MRARRGGLAARTAAGVVAAMAVAGHATPSSAQIPADVRGLGMGHAHVALVRGQQALFVNPANLALHGPRWSVALPQAVVGGSTAGPGLTDLRAADDATDARKREIVALVPDAGWGLDAHLRAPIIVFQIGSLAFGIAAGGSVHQTLGRDLVELAILGYEPGRTDYAVGNTVGDRFSYLDIAVAYGRRLGPVAVGITGRYLSGGTLSRSRLYEPRYDHRDFDMVLDYYEVMARGGRGLGLDLGVAAEPAPGVTVGASITNAWGRMTWNEELRYRHLELTDRDFQGDLELDEILTRFRDSERDLDPGAAPIRVIRLTEPLYQGAYLPATLHLGAGWEGGVGTRVAVAYRDRLTTGRLESGWWDRSASIGAEQRLVAGLGVRAGLATDFDGGRLLSGGLALGPLQMAVARLAGDEDGTRRSALLVSAGISVSR